MSDLPRMQRQELLELASAISDQSLSDEQVIRLERLLLDSAEARLWYVRWMDMHFELQEQLPTLPAGDAAKPADAVPSAESTVSRKLGRFVSQPTRLSMIVAAVVISLLVTAMALVTPPFYRVITHTESGAKHDALDHQEVAQLTGARKAVWADGQVGSLRGAHLTVGHRMELTSGMVELTYDSGARVVLEGPAVYEVRGEKAGFLQQGKLVAQITKEAAQGFAVETPHARVEDLGTEFGVEVQKGVATEVVVLAGAVDLVVTRGTDSQGERVRLTQGQGAKVGAESGKIARADRVRPDSLAAMGQRLNADFPLVADDPPAVGDYEGAAEPGAWEKEFFSGTITHNSPAPGLGTAVWKPIEEGGDTGNRYVHHSAGLGSQWTVEARLRLEQNSDPGWFQLITRSGRNVEIWLNETDIRTGTTPDEGTVLHQFESVQGDGRFHTIRVALDAHGIAHVWWDGVRASYRPEVTDLDQAIWGDSRLYIEDGAVVIEYVRYRKRFLPHPLAIPQRWAEEESTADNPTTVPPRR